MFKKLTDTTATYGLGLSTAKLLFEIPSGVYSGRLIAIVQTASGTLRFSYSDAPNNIRSSFTDIVTDCADRPFDAAMGSDFNIYVVYSKVTTEDLMNVKLSFADGLWTAGSPVTIFNAEKSRNPTLVIESLTNLHVAWSRDQSGSFTLCTKSSTDSGATWGTGVSDPGDVLTGGSSSVFPKLLLGISDLYLVYVDNVTEIDFRSKPLSGGSWTSEFNIASGTDFDNNFDAAVSENGLLAVAYDNLELRYREYDGSNWGPSVLLDSSESFMPQMIFINNVPFVIYTVKDSSDQMLLQYTSRKSGVFSTPEILNKSAGYFDSVFLYDLSSAAYSDLTSESQSSSTADIYHPSSSVIFKESGDILYLGIDQKFRQLYLILFTSGIGGTLVYSYWDGSNWKSFTPVNGNYNFDSAEKKLLLWTDYQSMPTDWQKRIINGTDRYWIKIETGSAFSTAPVGSQITTISDVNSFIIRR